MDNLQGGFLPNDNSGPPIAPALKYPRSLSIGQNAVIWVHLPAKELGKCSSVYIPSRRKKIKDFGKQTSFSLNNALPGVLFVIATSYEVTRTIGKFLFLSFFRFLCSDHEKRAESCSGKQTLQETHMVNSKGKRANRETCDSEALN